MDLSNDERSKERLTRKPRVRRFEEIRLSLQEVKVMVGGLVNVCSFPREEILQEPPIGTQMKLGCLAFCCSYRCAFTRNSM